MNGSDNGFLDYYRILQVHPGAEPEIIHSAYNRLAGLYHPGVSKDPNSDEKMRLIEQAYATVSNPALRRAYHRLWLEHHADAGQHAPVQPGDESQQLLDDYFRCLLEENWSHAYQKLSAQDRRRVPLKDFCEWKKAAKTLCQMGAYAVRFFRTYRRCVVDGDAYDRVDVFFVMQTDRDITTGRVVEQAYTKYVVYERGGWRVRLGSASLEPLIYKLKYLAVQATGADAGCLDADATPSRDTLTGFLGRNGLLSCIEQEIARAQRFDNSFCLAVLSVQPLGFMPGVSGTDYLNMCLADAAAQLKNTMRAVDHAARFSERRVAVLVIQVDSQAANRALVRFLLNISPGEGLQYRLSGSPTVWQGESAQDLMLRAGHDASMRVDVGRDNIKKYHFTLDDHPV